jgi:hypothetical protein
MCPIERRGHASRFLDPLDQTFARSGSKDATGRLAERSTASAAVIFTRRGQRPDASSAKEQRNAERHSCLQRPVSVASATGSSVRRRVGHRMSETLHVIAEGAPRLGIDN